MSCGTLQGSRLATWSVRIGLFCLGASAALAQLVPPGGYFQWSGGGGDGLWQTGQNWIGGPNGNGGVPTIDADVLFANEPPDNNIGNPYQVPIRVTNGTASLRVNSLWFDTGREYTIGERSLILGSHLEDGGQLITGRNTDPSRWQSEHNIETDISINLPRLEWTAQIASYSAGGLRIGGRLNFDQGNLRQTGGGAIHIAGNMRGNAQKESHNLTVATAAGHLILSGNNSGWRGNLTVNHGFLVATANNALGSTSRSVTIAPTASGATLAFRPKFVGPGLNNSPGMDYTSEQPVTVTGLGYQRPWGSADPHDPYSALNLRPVGAIYNDGGNNTFAGDITVLGDTWFGSRQGVLTLTGRLFGEEYKGWTYLNLTKVGHGVIALSNDNPGWDEGSITIREGVLRMSHTKALNLPNSLISLAGGILELGAGNFSGTLGIDDPGYIGWDGVNDSGGFSAFGANRSVTLNNNDELTWGSGSNGNWSTGGFVSAGALLLGSDYGTHQILLRNAIRLNAANREVRVARGATTAAHAALNGKLSGTGGLLKTGLGTLWLNVWQNNYTGATVIREGTLGGRVPSNSRIDLNGGVLGIDSNFSRSLGSANDRIRWLSNRDGGFANYSNDARIVTLGAAGSTVSFGQANFVSAAAFLIFGAYDANGTVFFNNRIGLRKEATSRIRVISGQKNGAVADVLFSRKFYGPAAPVLYSNQNYNLLFEGDGRADISQVHTINDWEGSSLQVRGAELRLNQAGTLQGLTGNWLLDMQGNPVRFGPGSISAEWGGTITLDNQGSYNSLDSGGQSVADRLYDQITIALNAGSFRLWGGNTHLVETAGELRLVGGANMLEVRSHILNVRNPQYAVRLHLSKLVHDGFQHPTINFVGVQSPSVGIGAFLSFAGGPALINGIYPYATVNGTDWARTQTQNGLNYLTAYSGYQMGGQESWTATTVNASPASNVTLSANRSLNSLRLASGRQVNLGSRTLTLNSGGLLATKGTPSAAGAKILGGTLTSGQPLYVHVYNTASVGLEISSTIQSPALIKTGPGLLLLSGGGTVTATTTRIHEGTLALGKTSTNYLGGNIIVGDRAGTDILRLDRAEQIANNATVTLRGGHPDPSRFLMAEGILQFNGIYGSGVGIRETIGNLHIEGRGVIDFRGGEVGRANYLIINGNITFDSASRLFIRNWYEFEDYLLIRRNGAGLVNLNNIEFEGYGPAILRPWDGDYYQITPNPEPATYGAILGIVGIGLVVWRKKRRSLKPSHS